MTKPLATIAITAFNAEKTIEDALASAISQDWRPLEILVVDDASTDSTVQRVNALVEMHSEVRLLRHERNQGVAGARNSLLREAAGEFVIFFDDDDVSLPNRVSAQIARIEQYEARFRPDGPVVCHAARQQIMPNGEKRLERTMGTDQERIAPHGRRVAERILTGRPLRDGYGALATCSQAARRSVYSLVDGFDPALKRSEDTDIAIRLALKGAHFVGIAEPLVRQTMTLANEKTLQAECAAMLSLTDKHRALFGDRKTYLFARRWIEIKHIWIEGRYWRFALELAKLALSAPIKTARRLAYALPMSSSRAGWRVLHRGH